MDEIKKQQLEDVMKVIGRKILHFVTFAMSLALIGAGAAAVGIITSNLMEK